MEDRDVLIAIHRAIKKGQVEEVARLVGDDNTRLHVVTPFGTWLHDAASHGQLEVAKWLVDKGADVNYYDGTTVRRPLNEAAAEGHVEMATYLLNSGATLDVSESVRNPLFTAIVGGNSNSHTAIARLLIDRGVDVSVKYSGDNMYNMDALAFAREWGRTDIVALLEAKLAE